MAGELTALQEKAAQLYVEGKTKSDAYRHAGYDVSNCTTKSINELACHLFADIKVLSRVEELQEDAANRHRVTVDSLTAELEEAKNFAYGLEQPSAAVSAIMGKAKIHGFDKQIIEGNLKMVKVRDMTGKK